MTDGSPYQREGETVDVVDDRLENSMEDSVDVEKRYRDEEWLYQQYHLLKRSIREIADNCDVWPKTIQRALDDFGIATRPAVRTATGPWGDEEWLREQYVERKKTKEQIADEQDCGPKTIYNWLVEHEIETRGPEDYPLDEGGDRRYRDEEWLREQYVERGQSASQIANECGLESATAIYVALEQHGIETRTNSEAKLLSEARPTVEQAGRDDTGSQVVESETGNRSYRGPSLNATMRYLSEKTSDDGGRLISPYRDEEWLRAKYEEYGSVSPIADLCQVDPTTIHYWMDRYDIERTNTGQRQDPEGRELYTDEEWLREKYEEHGTVAELVRKEPVDVTEATIQNWMDKSGIDRRDAGEVGPEARREKGVMAYEEFLDALIEIRDGHEDWPNSKEYDEHRLPDSPSSSKAYQFEEMTGWNDSIADAKARRGDR